MKSTVPSQSTRTRWLAALLLAVLLGVAQPGLPLIVDHTCTTMAGIPDSYIESIKDNARIYFVSASHGRQLLTGLERIAARDSKYAFSVDWSLPKLANTLCMQYQNQDPDEYFSSVRAYLKAEPTINVSMFFWCGEANWYDPNLYFAQMESLEVEYPKVKFIYATGHAQEDGCAGCNRHRFNEAIREYCRTHDKILFDFADMDVWYNGEMNTYVSPGYCACAGEKIPLQHPQYDPVEDNHTSFESCENKGRAVWYMLAKIGGWSSTSAAGASAFSVTAASQQAVLRWQATSVSTTLGFVIERGVDRNTLSQIAYVGTSEGAESSDSYQYVDRAVESGTTYYYRIRQLNRDGSSTYSAIQELLVKTPALFELNQNYPNPFKGSTRFSYLLPRDSWIEISVCDLSGRLVTLLQRGMSGMGHKTLQWDGRDTFGNRVADGLYLLRMTDGRSSRVRRMVVLN
jgi:hypothetical protein